MTGFARVDGSHGDASWTWEFRSVNGKGLDVRLRLPSGFERLEPTVKKTTADALARGNVQANLSLKSGMGTVNQAVNAEALGFVLDAISEIDAKGKTTPSSAVEILGVRGVLETAETKPSDDEASALDAAILDSLAEALTALNVHRKTEGAALADLFHSQLNEIETLTARAEVDPSRSVDAIRQKMAEQVALLAGASTTLDTARLYQEAALLATKADIREELDRLVAHIAAARDLLAQGSPVGRKLEFLAQEFNREANTLCSKSNAVSVTEIGLSLKVTIDQFREQVLNVE